MVYIVGKGRVGTGLSLLDEKIKLLGREAELTELKGLSEDDLVFLCTRNDSLDHLFQQIPSETHKNIVLVQNGMLSPFVSSLKHSIAGRAILYFAVSKKGEKPLPGGDTLVNGSQSKLISDFFSGLDIPNKLVSDEELEKVEMEKLLWNSVMGLFGDVYDEDVASTLNRWPEVENVLDELLPMIEEDTGLSFDKKGLYHSLKNYSQEVSHFSARIKEWDWRNEWFFLAAKRTGAKLNLWNDLHARTNFAEKAKSYSENS